MKRKAVARLAFLTAAALTLSGCQSKVSYESSGTGEAVQSNEQSTGSSEESEDSQIRSIVYMYPWYGTIPSGIEDVENAVNTITLEKIQTHVDLRPVSAASFSQQMALALAGEEKIDLATIPDEFMTMLAQDQLMDITDLIHERGQGILDAVGIFISGTMRNGRIYGVTPMGGKALSIHFLMRTDWLMETGVDIGRIVPTNSRDVMEKNIGIIEQIFKKVKENHPDADILVASEGELKFERLITYDTMGDHLGVLMGGTGDHIENLYASDEYRGIVQLAKRWSDLGYIMEDASFNTANSGDILKAGNAFCDIVVTQQGVEAQYKQTTGYDFTAVEVGLPLLYTGQSLECVNTVPVGCTQPEAAIDFLNLMYTDKELVNLLAYGVEGEHYRFMPDGTVDYPEGVTAQNSEYPCSQTWLFGNTLLDHVKVGNVPELYKIQAKANDTAQRSAAFGFIYDNTPVLSEVVACEEIVDRYSPGLLSGELDIEMLDELNAKLKEAGIETIIKEKQKQFDLWRYENRDNPDTGTGTADH